MFKKTVKDVVKSLQKASTDLADIKSSSERKAHANLAAIERLHQRNDQLNVEYTDAHALQSHINLHLGQIEG